MTTPLKILFKLTTRSRPEKAFNTIKSIVDNCNSEEYHIHLSIDVDDPTMTDKSIVDKFLGEYNNRSITVGDSKNKIDAINRDMDKILYDWDILVNVSDDQVFIKKGFDDVIRKSFFKDINMNDFVHENHLNIYNLDQFLHFPDGNREDLCTMSIIGKPYYERDNYIYHQDYRSVYCDNEAQDVAKIRGCYKFVNEQIFSHEHPAYGKGTHDTLYVENDKHYAADHATYELRKHKNFDIITGLNNI